MKTAGNDTANAGACAAASKPASRIDWRQELADAIRDPALLLRQLQLDPELFPAACAADAQFPLLVPPHYLSLIEAGNPRDPLLLQVLPAAAETAPQPARYRRDPLAETDEQPAAPGLLQKYHGRSLLVTTGACAINCRYCFRRHFPYQQQRPATDWSAQLDALRKDPALREVILSGGDPLMLSDRRLAELLQSLDQLPQRPWIRLHSRMPVVIPSRISSPLLKVLGALRRKTVIVIHANHPRELSGQAVAALQALQADGHSLLNQSVLLRGVNDDAAVLTSLSETLFEAGVLPYYLHQLDPVLGSAHFEVTDDRARELHAAITARLPGYLVPRLVRELPGAASKLPLPEPGPASAGHKTIRAGSC